MTDTGGPDLEALARDWIALWQSELTALATDREARETMQASMALWAGALSAMMRATPRDSTPGTAPAAAASDPRDAEIRRLARHVAELEARLAKLERSDDPTGTGGT